MRFLALDGEELGVAMYSSPCEGVDESLGEEIDGLISEDDMMLYC